MKNQQVRLTEQDLHMIVEDAVMNILRENGADEGALWNAFKQKGAQIGKNMYNRAANATSNAVNKAQQFGQGAMNVGRNMANTYQAGRQDAKLQKYAQKALQALSELQQIAMQTNPKIAKSINMLKGQLNNTLKMSAQNVQNVSQNTFSTQNPNQQ